MNKKRFIIRIIGFSTLIVSLFITCSDDFFDTTTDDRISPDKFYNSMIDAELSVAGCLSLLQNVAENIVLVDGLQSDQLDVTANADADMIALNMHNATGTNSYLDPANFYKIILNVNELMPNLNKIFGKDREFDSLNYNAYIGALTTLRCWAYYTTFKIYGKVTLMPSDVKNMDLQTPRMVITDKNTLIDTLLAELHPLYDSLDLYRYPFDMYALMGEMYLDKGDYTNAEKYLKYTLEGDYMQEYRGAMMMVNNAFEKTKWKEIFIEPGSGSSCVFTAVPYSIESGHKNNIEEWVSPNFNYMVKPTSALLDSFYTQVRVKAGDPLGDLYRGIKISFDTTASGEAYVNKYSLPNNYRNGADVILYRDADIHLMLAEAINRLGKQDIALILLNKGVKGAKLNEKPAGYPLKVWNTNIGVRGRVALTPRIVPDTIKNGDPTKYVEYVEDLIIEERNLELAFEGKRWFDLKRIAEHRNNPAYLLDKVCGKFNNPADSIAVRNNLTTNMQNWYLKTP